MPGTLHEDQHTSLIKSRSVLVTIRDVSDKIQTHVMFNTGFFFFSKIVPFVR